MGRTPVSGWRLLRRLRRAGFHTTTFGYAVAFSHFDAIVARLRAQIVSLAATNDYIVIGHSLGGVLLRAALDDLPLDTVLPRRVYLLGSPVLPSRIATCLQRNWLYRMLTGDCGQLLASADRMHGIGAPTVPVVGVAGTLGIPKRWGIFGDEVNDGLVSVSEVCAPWFTQAVEVRVFHTVLPSSLRVVDIVLQDLRKCGLLPAVKSTHG